MPMADSVPMTNAATTRVQGYKGLYAINNVATTGMALPEGWSIEWTLCAYITDLGETSWTDSIALVSRAQSSSYDPFEDYQSAGQLAERARHVCCSTVTLSSDQHYATKRSIVIMAQASSVDVSRCSDGTWHLQLDA
jgi:hypothetical protein